MASVSSAMRPTSLTCHSCPWRRHRERRDCVPSRGTRCVPWEALGAACKQHNTITTPSQQWAVAGDWTSIQRTWCRGPRFDQAQIRPRKYFYAQHPWNYRFCPLIYFETFYSVFVEAVNSSV